MTADVAHLLPSLRDRRDRIGNDLYSRFEEAQSEGRGELTDLERRDWDEWRGLQDRVRYMESEELRKGNTDALYGRAGGSDHRKQPAVKIPEYQLDHLTYRKQGKESWIRDMVMAQIGQDTDGDCRRRLAQHGDEVRNDPVYRQMEFRDISRVDGSGGYAVPPAWLLNQYIELARPGRAFANLVQRQPLPGGTDSLNIPKLLTGTAVGIQTADNQTITDVDLSDTFINLPVRTIAGQEGVAIQLIDQSPIAFDDVVFRDLVAAHAAATDLQVIDGTGTSGQVLGINYTAGITTITANSTSVEDIYGAIANGIQTIHTTRFLPPEVIVMHPRRWGALLASFDTVGRPLFIPNAQGPMNVGGVLTEVASQQVVGTVQGLPVVTDPLITTTAGNESPSGTEDIIYVLRASDLVLFESGIRARVLPETKAANLTVLLQIFSYLAFSAARYPQSVVAIGGLTAPSW